MYNTLVAIDPGSKNYSLSILENGFCVGTSLLKESIQELKEAKMYEAIKSYEQALEEILVKANVKTVIIERWIVRGFASNSTELVGIMIGILIKTCSILNINLVLVSAAQWKVPLKKQLDLKALYKQYWAKPYRIVPHTIDSLLIGRYMFNGRKFTDKDECWIHETLSKLPTTLFPKRKFYFKLNNSSIVF